MKLVLTLFAFLPTLLTAEIPEVADSTSPDGRLHAVMDIDRDPTIEHEWKGDDYAKIEITEKDTGKVVISVNYFGDIAGDERPLREHVEVKWRSDSQAFAITINDRFYSNSQVYTLNGEMRFVPVKFPEYENMTSFPRPDSKHLRPRGRATIIGWNDQGQLIYDLFFVPLPSFTGNDPLKHRVFLEVSANGMEVKNVEHEKGIWKRGDWVAKEE